MQHITRKWFFVIMLPFLSPQAFSNGMIGESKDSHFYPSPQAYKVVAAKFNDINKVPIDLRGIPAILRGSTIVFTEKYFTLKNINSGSTTVIGSCFEQIGNVLIVRPIRRLFMAGKSSGRGVS